MITGVILARNEENNIVGCVESIRPHVSELILIDMDSSDDTVSLAQSYVDRVLHHSVVANFDPVRNISIDEAKNDWLWFVDADERVSHKTAAAVKELILSQGDSFEAINIPFKTYFCGKWIEHSGWWPGYTMPRVLKRGFFKFSERLHGGVELNGREIRLPPDPELGVDHYSYLSIEHYIEKFNRYTSTEARQLAEANQSIDWRNGIAHMVHDLWMYYERNQGNLDGRHGWILAWLSGQYRWLSHAKLLDEKPDTAEPNASKNPESLSDVFRVFDQELERLRSSTFQLPNGIVWRSPVWDPSGYADEGRCIARALSRTGRHISLENIPWNDTACEIPDEDRALLRAMQRCKRAETNIVITNCIPTLVAPDRAATLNILRTTFETDRIPAQWLSRLEAFDEIWVISKQNELSFRRSGVAPEKLRRVPSFIDTDLYKPDGPTYQLPSSLESRFVFVSVFDWQLRKGWDLLLKSYCETFGPDDDVGLLLKISRMHGKSLESVRSDAAKVLATIGQDLDQRTDIVFLDENLTAQQMAALYRAANAFVLSSRGEGWGRPYMEAMACGLPTIGTKASGNIDFMNAENSFLIEAKPVPVSHAAAAEIPPYSGHCWWEPNQKQLSKAMRDVHKDNSLRNRICTNAIRDVRENYGMESGQRFWEEALGAVEKRFGGRSVPPPSTNKHKVVLEGEFFANHSFANINEQLATMFIGDGELAFSIDRKFHNPTADRENIHQGTISDRFGAYPAQQPGVTIRHAFPPNWQRPQYGKWVHIQPWEFGHLPKDWIAPLASDVDEIWVPSNYVRKVYINSGIPENKVQVIPWGIDSSIFNPNVPERLLPTERQFKFVFVGGTIARKGFDRLLEAYLTEFSDSDDVTLVIKDLGTKTFYRYGNFRDQILEVLNDPSKPEIVYFDQQWTAGQLASLYAACDCLVIPYRGEGFGLPILEAMACGIPPIVPTSGASDDFVSPQTGILVSGMQVESTHDWELTGPALEIDIDVKELREKMRWAFENQKKVAEVGASAAKEVQANWTWSNAFAAMKERLAELTRDIKPVINRPHFQAPKPAEQTLLAVCVHTKDNEQAIGNCLSRIRPDVSEIIVFDEGSTDRTKEIAREYGARVIEDWNGESSLTDQIAAKWFVELEPSLILSEAEVGQLLELVQHQPDVASEVTMGLGDYNGFARPEKLSAVRNPKSKNLVGSC